MITKTNTLRLNVAGAGVVLVMALGALTAFAYLGSRSLWFDEITGATVACLPTEEDVLAAQDMDSHPPGTALLEHWSRRAFGITEWAFRLPAALASTLMLAVVVAIAAFWGNVRVGWLAAALAAVSPTYVLYAQDARPYAVAALWVACATACFLAAWRGRRPWLWWPLYALSVALAFYTHYFTTMAVAAHILIVAAGFVPAFRPPAYPRARSYVVAAVFFLLALAAAGAATADVFLKAAADRARFPGGLMFLSAPLALGALGHVGWDRAAANVLFALAAINGVVHLGRRYGRAAALAAATLAFVPVFLPIIAIRLTTQYWNPRFSYFAFPTFMVVAAYGFAPLIRNLWGARRRYAGAAATLVVLAAGAAKACVDDWYAVRVTHMVENQDFRGAVALSNRNRDWQTSVLIWPYRNMDCYKFYTQTQGGPDLPFRPREEVEEAFATRPRVFLISTDDEYDDELMRKFPTTIRMRLARINVLYHDAAVGNEEELYWRIPPAILGAPAGTVDTALGRWALERGKIDRAIPFLERGVRDGVMENAEVIRLADIYRDRGRYGPALALVGAYIRRHPDEAWPYTKIAGIYLKKGDVNSAILYYRRAVWLDPSREDWRETLAELVAIRPRSKAFLAWSDPRWL